MKSPPDWDKDALTQFINQARNNQFATFQQIPEQYEMIKDLDDLFLSALDNLNNPSDIVSPFFFFRSHSAFRASSQLAMAGQIPESYMVMRGCLEFALYGVYFWRHPDDFETWCNRHDSPGARKKVRKKFTYGNLVKAVPGLNPSDRAMVDDLYNLAIDLGAHPNQRGLFYSLKKIEEPDVDRWDTLYLTAESRHIQSALRHVAQFGVCSFGLMSHVFGQRFALVDLDRDFKAIKQTSSLISI